MFLCSLKPQDSLGQGLQIKEPSRHPAGLKCYQQLQFQGRPQETTIRTFGNANKESGKELDPKGKRMIDYNPTIKKDRPQRSHLSMPQCDKEVAEKGIKVWKEASKLTAAEYALEKQLQEKTRVTDIQQKRNGIAVMALGDKSYKHPERSSDFYKSGGLVSGSSIRMRKGVQLPQFNVVPLSKPNYDEMVKIKEAEEDRNYIEGLEAWEEATLKEGNPNLKDPKQEKQDTKKDAKKAPKK